MLFRSSAICASMPASLARAERYAKLSRTEKRFVAQIIDVLLEQNAQQSPVASN